MFAKRLSWATAVALLVIPASLATAATRSGTATRSDDGLGSGKTITSVTASYEDQGGRLEVNVSFPDVLGGNSTVLHVYFRSDAGCNAGPGDIELRALTDTGSDTAQNPYALSVYSRDLPGGHDYGTKTSSAQQIDVYYASPKLATLDLRCVVVQTGGPYYDPSTMTAISAPPTFATLDPPLYFTGFGSAALSPPDGPVSGTPGTIVFKAPTTGRGAPICRRPNLRGKTLAAAKLAIKKAHCTLGRVTHPKVKPGTHLVVKKQSGSPRISLTLGRKLPRKR